MYRLMTSAIVLLTLLLTHSAYGQSSTTPSKTKPAANQASAEPSSAKQTKSQTESQAQANASKSRSFRFTYGVTLTELEQGKTVKVWIPLATDTPDQKVVVESVRLPAIPQMTVEKKFGNHLLYFEAQARENGELPLQVDYRITRREITAANYESAGKDDQKWLNESKLVPNSEKLRQAVLSDANSKGSPLELAQRLYQGVGKHMKYDKPADKPGWGKGDAVWACDNGFGNCTDFHSLFISSARSLKIPAKFEIGFPIPTQHGAGEVGGYHCWAKFLSEGKWVPVDISEADKNPELAQYFFGNLTEDRVSFSTGRDLELVPAPAAKTVNYLAYPYVEVEGKRHTKFRKEFRYEDLQKGQGGK